MPRLALLQLLFALCTPLTVCSGAAFAQLDQLAIRVPSSANAIVIINAKAAYASPLARAQNWTQGDMQAHNDGMMNLPTSVESFLMAAEMDFEFMQPYWEISVAHVRQMPAMSDIATRSGGRLDRLAGSQAVERPNDSYVVTLGPKVIGAMSPANRQQVTSWVRKSQRRKSSELSPYLAESLTVAGKSGSHLVMAFELEGILAAAEIASDLAKNKILINDIELLSETIASVRGIRLKVELQNPPQGQLSIDLGKDATNLSKLAKPLLLAVMAKHGVAIEDFQDWKVRTAGKSILLQGELSQSGLRRVLSVLSSPVGPMSAPASPTGSSNDAVAEASQRYFQSVTNYLNDLFFSNRRPQSLFQVKTWVERYARKIEDLSTNQVDEEVVAFGRDVVASLHEIVSVVNRAERRTDLRDATLYEPGRRRYGRYGYFEKSYVARDRELVQADEAHRGLQEGRAIVEELRNLSARTRETMTERYDRQF